jgi:hypothetical protein
MGLIRGWARTYINPASVHDNNFPSSNAFGTVAQSWPPSLDLCSATDNENSDAAYSPSLVFSAGIFTPDDEGSWTYFNPQFTSQSQICHSSNTTAAIDLTKERPQAPHVVGFPFPIVPAPPALMIQAEDDNCDAAREIAPLNKPSISSKRGGRISSKKSKSNMGKAEKHPTVSKVRSTDFSRQKRVRVKPQPAILSFKFLIRTSASRNQEQTSDEARKRRRGRRRQWMAAPNPRNAQHD